MNLPIHIIRCLGWNESIKFSLKRKGGPDLKRYLNASTTKSMNHSSSLRTVLCELFYNRLKITIVFAAIKGLLKQVAAAFFFMYYR